MINRILFRPASHAWAYLLPMIFGGVLLIYAVVALQHASMLRVIMLGLLQLLLGISEWVPRHWRIGVGIVRLLTIGCAVALLIVVTYTL